MDLRTSKVLAAIYTSSSTAYYVDTRGARPLLFRARGQGRTGRGRWDDVWVALTDVESGPRLNDVRGRELDDAQVDWSDVRPWVLRVGSRHQYTFDPGGPDLLWWVQRVAERIEILADMPPEAERSRRADEVDFLDGPHPSPGAAGP
ncbi:hypothetical protein QQX10_10615 [Demequina sp. SYSU T00039]|uniref:Uncharacterized protein n=1 Tax=Demequina lignilytica TaxID=3051663 RepID=A0AAW7M3X6_9MICO|nr:MULTISPECIES: hypothetical protein [unclassified Demequina]MDN4478641.1 hypothetical protein [Demequina sp. SYSU T00039-1]MDN4488619.1 hypothetical protein [Demequina sp. SYSU T00039]